MGEIVRQYFCTFCIPLECLLCGRFKKIFKVKRGVQRPALKIVGHSDVDETESKESEGEERERMKKRSQRELPSS